MKTRRTLAPTTHNQVTVTATDDGVPSESSTLEVTVTVTNENEPGRIGPITGIAQVGEVLTAGDGNRPGWRG